MALPSRPARESPEEGYYSGLRSGSEVPTACPSQLFKVWQRGRVWYQWNADSLLVGLVPLASSKPLSPTLSVAFSSFTTCRMEELARRCFKGLSPFSPWQPWLCKCRAVTLATALIPLHFKSQEEGMLFLICVGAYTPCVSLALLIPQMKA